VKDFAPLLDDSQKKDYARVAFTATVVRMDTNYSAANKNSKSTIHVVLAGGTSPSA
jgi:hypothetical protein